MAHVCIAFANVLYGVGGIVGKIALGDISPPLFVTLRALSSSALFFFFAGGVRYIPRKEWRFMIVCVVGMYLGQLFYALGLKLANPFLTSIWQPTQPVFTLFFTTIAGSETPTLMRTAGMLVAFVGCLYISTGGDLTSLTQGSQDGAGGSQVLAHALLCVGSAGSALVILGMRAMTQRGYSAPLVSAWTAFAVSVLSAISVAIFSQSPRLLKVACPAGCGSGLDIPNGFWPPFAYIVVFMTLIPYLLTGKASKTLEGSVLATYTVVQPITSAAATTALLSAVPSLELEKPGPGALVGTLTIVAGLLLVLKGGPVAGGNADKGDKQD